MRLWPRTIVAQITTLIAIAVVLAIGLTSAVHIFVTRDWHGPTSLEIAAAARAARIATVVDVIRAARTPEERRHIVTSVQRNWMEVDMIPRARMPSPADDARMSSRSRLILQRLEEWPGTSGDGPATSGDGPFVVAGRPDAVIVPLDGQEALVFQSPAHPMMRRLLMNSAGFLVAMITFLVLFLSIYAARWVIAPLSSIAAAARSFGRSATGRSTEESPVLREDGPQEIAHLAAALNEMRRRVVALVDERTRMLVAISHDLRTPLTRLRQRAEQLRDAPTRDRMLDDIAMINDLLAETLVYLGGPGSAEPSHRVDLPSLLQTICAPFIDIGHDVTYEGPPRYAFVCRARALGRAITNIVENATKHGTTVSVALREANDKAVCIEISDDGPGIPPELREKVFEPFFKGDAARTSSRTAGFGLGLSIARDIIRRHGGEIELSEHRPHGLVVRIRFDPAWNAPASRDAKQRETAETVSNAR